MRKFKLIAGESLRAASPVRLFLVDDFASRPPFGAINPVLEQVVGTQSVPVPVRPRFGASGILVYPNLGLVARPGPNPLTFRLTLSPDYYTPYYRRHLDELRFEVAPFNHETPPAGTVPAAVLKPPAIPDDARFLLPNIRYPFGSHVTILYGRVIRKRQLGKEAEPGKYVRLRGVPDGDPLAAVLGGAASAAAVAAADVHIRYGVQQVALTDADGWFALPLKTSFPHVLLDVSWDRPDSPEYPAFPSFPHEVKWDNKTTYLTKPTDWIELPV